MDIFYLFLNFTHFILEILISVFIINIFVSPIINKIRLEKQGKNSKINSEKSKSEYEYFIKNLKIVNGINTKFK